jgi:hypothetical protein
VPSARALSLSAPTAPQRPRCRSQRFFVPAGSTSSFRAPKWGGASDSHMNARRSIATSVAAAEASPAPLADNPLMTVSVGRGGKAGRGRLRIDTRHALPRMDAMQHLAGPSEHVCACGCRHCTDEPPHQPHVCTRPGTPQQDSQFPLFADVSAEHVVPAMTELLAQLHEEIRCGCMQPRVVGLEAWGSGRVCD